MPYKWTRVEDEILKSNINGKSYSQMSSILNQKGYTRSKVSVERRCKKLGIKNTYYTYWTIEEDDILKTNISLHSFKQLSDLINEYYGYFRRTEYACQRRCTILGITNSIDRKYKKDDRRSDNINVLPIGSIRIVKSNKSKVVYIKISDIVSNKKAKGHSIGNNKNWYPYGRYIYEQYYGKLTNNEIIVHLDGNPLNNDISNLEAVSKKVFVDMTRNKLHFKNSELTKASILVSKLDVSIYENQS